MGEKSIQKQFYGYLWAYILVALSGCLGNVVDGIIVGNLISEDGVSAINLSKPINQFIFTLHLLINAGAGMLVAYALGKNNIADARRFFTRALCLSAGLGVLLAIVGGLLFPSQTARLLCSNEHILPLAQDYMQVLLIGNPAFILMWGLSTMVGVDGSPKLVSAAVIIDNTVNLSLDIVFIKFFGWGITGSSAATVVGHLVGIAILLSHWCKPENRRLRLQFGGGSLLTSWKRIISQGAPLALASICLTLLLLSANTIVLSTTGRAGIFVFALCMNLLQVYNLFLSGTCQTLQSLGAIQVGKGDGYGVKAVVNKGLRFITIAMVVTCALVWIWPQGIARLFGCDDPAMLAESNHALRVFALSFIPFCYIYVLMIIYKLYSYHKMALFISLALSLTVIPVLWAMSQWAPKAIWYSYLVAYVIEAIVIYILHKSARLQFRLKTAA
jgi:Na+-driven multidrug efflux pump